jgi:hypothetical protein
MRIKMLGMTLGDNINKKEVEHETIERVAGDPSHLKSFLFKHFVRAM